MLAQSQLEMCFEKCDGGGGEEEEEYLDFSDGNLLDSIDFDDFFVGINDEDVLPDLEMDPEILVEFSDSGGDEYSQPTTATSVSMEKLQETPRLNEEDVDKGINTSSDISSDSTNFRNKKDLNPTAKKGEERRKSSKQSSRNAHGKRKVKVDWTPELHRRFVQAVEQLGVDKAVPSRILELMGIDCLTRHNIASHLQKYRSHRKNLLAREAEATSWSQKRQLYNAPAGGKRVMNPWHTPTIGFPPPMAAPPPQIHPHFRPLHVWGHPSINQPSMQHVWSKHLGAHAPPLQPQTWPSILTPQPPPPPSPSDHSFWNSQQRHVSNSPTPGIPYFPPHLTPARFPAQPVPGIPPATMYRLEPGIGVPVATPGQAIPQPPVEFHPSKESIDAAIGDVISKPWLPLPLGLKPPCVDGVLVELQRQGIPKIPPGTAV